MQQDKARRLAQGVSVVQRDPESENRVRGMRSMDDVGNALVHKSEVSLPHYSSIALSGRVCSSMEDVGSGVCREVRM